MAGYRRGDDWDLEAAIIHNETGITVEQVAEALAAVYGEHDESNCFWVLRLTDGTVGMLQLQGVPPEKSAYQVVMARMGFPKAV